MNNPEIDKKLSGAIDEVISIYLESTDVEVIDLFRSLTRHVISLNYQYASNYRSATAMIAQCLNDVMCDLQEQKIFNDEFKDNLKIINNQIKQIEKLVNEFSDFARMPKPIFKKNYTTNICLNFCVASPHLLPSIFKRLFHHL